MAKPLIGIIPSRRTDPQGAPHIDVPEAYVQAVTAAGGASLVIPLGLPEDVLAEILSRLDGVLFSGGSDVHPSRYGSQMHPKVEGVDLDRDRVELYAFQAVSQLQKPFLGICRGFQVINVALGGSLYEDILDQHPAGLDHRRGKHARDYLAHAVAVAPGSRLAELLGDTHVQVNSMHHQGVRQLAPSLQATATAPDGIIEAFELPDYPFGLAVQWHPECLPEHAEMRRLFEVFIQAAGDRHSS
jgi:putative glutamine amidotransferase